ncbi:hypothetical protein [Trichormus variabilis]|uniref:Uncharacterized protein n=1 Tax=Trichormus variabilis SAG 1403-4b TaxID=447716 RepID=A0A433UFE5_ANAVA|nr:hypothetical protein [Trichormus variabilis]MBD2629893.1 hypothetical protein [Trichormus variabilis FACHB-164]RUS92533.1 hypothetical protein DSM107003_50160 [Trichormus variabilis SAG 1403-4b]
MPCVSNLLDFQELRNKCAAYLQPLAGAEIKNFNRQDCGLLREEIGNFIEELERQQIDYKFLDLTSAFYSVIHEFQTGVRFLPNALIAPKNNVYYTAPMVARLNRFTVNYPFVSVFFYKNTGSYELRKTSEYRDLNEFNLVLDVDPLAKSRW